MVGWNTATQVKVTTFNGTSTSAAGTVVYTQAAPYNGTNVAYAVAPEPTTGGDSVVAFGGMPRDERSERLQLRERERPDRHGRRDLERRCVLGAGDRQSGRGRGADQRLAVPDPQRHEHRGARTTSGSRTTATTTSSRRWGRAACSAHGTRARGGAAERPRPFRILTRTWRVRRCDASARTSSRAARAPGSSPGASASRARRWRGSRTRSTGDAPCRGSATPRRGSWCSAWRRPRTAGTGPAASSPATAAATSFTRRCTAWGSRTGRPRRRATTG